jgi:hypothetical protein
MSEGVFVLCRRVKDVYPLLRGMVFMMCVSTYFCAVEMGVYEISCRDCNPKYVGQTGWSFRLRNNEHIDAIHGNKTTSKYAQHILDTGHSYGSIEDSLKILHHNKKE